MKITNMQVHRISYNKKRTKQQLCVTLDPSTYAGRWGVNEMFRCQKYSKHNCRWPALHRLGTVEKISGIPKTGMRWSHGW